MTLRLPPGHRLLRLTALTAANCGESTGTAAVDRPVARDSWHGLPYLPGSALKGVLGVRLGPNRETLFGAADDDLTGGGRPAEVILGDGEPLAFPLLLGNGRRGFVFVAATLYRLVALGLLEAPGLLRVERQDGVAVDGAAVLPAVAARLRRARFGVSLGWLRRLAGIDASAPAVLAAPQAARLLWEAAVEARTLTALDAAKVVRGGSLRRIELVPAGTVFLSLVTNRTSIEVDLGSSAALQIGAWEGIGLGWFAAEGVAASTAEASGEEELGVAEPIALHADPPHEVMLRAFEAVETLRGRPEAGRARSAIFDLGPRLRIRGLPATLAFCLAKAGGGEPADSPGSGDAAVLLADHRERRAYRWLLGQLFGIGADAAHAVLHARVVAVIGGEARPPGDFEPTRLWLRRYAETMLPREGTGG